MGWRSEVGFAPPEFRLLSVSERVKVFADAIPRIPIHPLVERSDFQPRTLPIARSDALQDPVVPKDSPFPHHTQQIPAAGWINLIVRDFIELAV